MSLLLLDEEEGEGLQPLAGLIEGSSSVTGQLDVALGLSANVTGTSTPSLPNLRVARPLSANVTGTGVVTAQFGGQRALAATVTGTTTVAGYLIFLNKALRSQGVETGSSTVTGLLSKTSNSLEAELSGEAAVEAALGLRRRLVTAVNGQAVVTGQFTVTKSFSVLSAGATTVIASLQLATPLGGTVEGETQISATLAVDTPADLEANVTGSSTVQADLFVALLGALGGTSRGVTTVTAELESLFEHLGATVTGSSTVTAALSKEGEVDLEASVAGSSTVTAGLSTPIIVVDLTAESSGTSEVSGNLGVLLQLATEVAGEASVEAALATAIGLSTDVAGAATVEADLAVADAAGEVSLEADASAGVTTITAELISEFEQLLGLLMLIDPSFVTELDTTPTIQTFNFVKKVVKGLRYVNATAVGRVITGQVRTGDGINLTEISNISVRSLGPSTTTVLVLSGTGMGSSGTGNVWLKTTAAGTFQIQVNGTGPILVEMQPKQGVLMSTEVT